MAALAPFDPGLTLAAALAAYSRPPPAGSLLGLEHEFTLADGNQPVDFRSLIHSLPIDGLRLDPGDINAYRCRSGLALTCDEAEAEVATPPLPVRPGFVSEVEDWDAASRSELQSVLPGGLSLTGYSTHLSAALPDSLAEATADLYARTLAPALALLMERPDSHGLYVRPRPGRLELCGEYVEGPRLGAVAAFVAGSVRACAMTIIGDPNAPTLPPPLRLQLLPSRERYGLRVLRDALGFDLYAAGRRAVLPLDSGATLPASQYLDLAWTAARAALGADARPADLAVADQMVAGDLPLGVEGELPNRSPASPTRLPSSEFGRLLQPRARPGFTLRPVVATWDFTVFLLADGSRSRYVCIPRPALAPFLDLVEQGALDDTLRSHLEASPGRNVLASHAQTARPGVYDALPDPVGLLAPERDPEDSLGPSTLEPGTRSAKSRRGKLPAGARPGKSRPFAGRPGKLTPSTIRPSKFMVPLPSPTTPPIVPLAPPPPPVQPEPRPQRAPSGPGRPPWVVLGSAIVALVVVVAGVVAVLSTSSSENGPEPTPTVTQALPTASPPRPTETTTPVASSTATAVKATETQAAGATTPSPTPSTPTSTPTVRPTDVANATVTSTATPSPTSTSPPTETPRPTATPTKSPAPTATHTATVKPTATKTPCTPTPGAICTPTPIP